MQYRIVFIPRCEHTILSPATHGSCKDIAYVNLLHEEVEVRTRATRGYGSNCKRETHFPRSHCNGRTLGAMPLVRAHGVSTQGLQRSGSAPEKFASFEGNYIQISLFVHVYAIVQVVVGF